MIPKTLSALSYFNQFILWRVDPVRGKMPVDYRTMQAGNAHDPGTWLSRAAAELLSACDPTYKIGFVFTANDPFFFIDLDACISPDGALTPAATGIINLFPGAAVERSISGTGAHIIGMYAGAPPPHCCKSDLAGTGAGELYTEARFMALGTDATGDCSADCTLPLSIVAAAYFPPSAGNGTAAEWTTGPCAEWSGPADDEELIKKALSSRSAGALLGGKASFRSLWTADADALGKSYPDSHQGRPYDASCADAALAQHLAFYTGKDCERIRRIMMQSALRREKWGREDYLPRTILHACGMQKGVYGTPKLPALRGTPAQRIVAEKIRDAKLSVCSPEQKDVLTAPHLSAAFWINSKEKSITEMCDMRKATPSPLGIGIVEPQRKTGYQLSTADHQMSIFSGCVYIAALNRIFSLEHYDLLDAEQFNNLHGGFDFVLNETGDKTTKKAWEAFTQSQVVTFPRVNGICFRPSLSPGAIVKEEGFSFVNTSIPPDIERTPGDPTPFTDLLRRLLPIDNDREIFLAYIAACVQYPGRKFGWAPLLQGAPGNGKTTITQFMKRAVGKRVSHDPPANELNEKFNDWLFGKFFVSVEDIHVVEGKREVLEVLKPLITNTDLSFRGMHKSRVMGENTANFIFNSNHRDAIQKTDDDRRFAIFYCAQQCREDIFRDGLTGEYFNALYKWANEGGYAIVSDYLYKYKIPYELNPAGLCTRAPITSSTAAAIQASMGSAEQEVNEAIQEGRVGMSGGWVSSIALDTLLSMMRLNRAIPQSKREEMMKSLGYILHPSLPGGRVNNPSTIGGETGRKPRLYVARGNPAVNLMRPADILRAYQEAQKAMAVETATAILTPLPNPPPFIPPPVR